MHDLQVTDAIGVALDMEPEPRIDLTVRWDEGAHEYHQRLPVDRDGRVTLPRLSTDPIGRTYELAAVIRWRAGAEPVLFPSVVIIDGA